jgi:hypothetical protein
VKLGVEDARVRDEAAARVGCSWNKRNKLVHGTVGVCPAYNGVVNNPRIFFTFKNFEL